MSTKIISVVNQKGGVGKTTTVVNLASVFAALKKRTLIIDFDPQGNATSSFNISMEEREKNDIYSLFSKEKSILNLILKTKIPLI